METTRNKLIIIRGAAGSGKSTIAEKLRTFFPKSKTAIIHTSVFYHEIVDGDAPEIAMENTKRILDNYLKNKYTVIIEGTLLFKNKKGNLYSDEFITTARKYKVPVKRFFFTASLGELKRREKKRRKISLRAVSKFYNLAIDSKEKGETIIDTTDKPISQVLSLVIGRIRQI